MARLKIKLLTWLMSIGVFVWFIISIFSSPERELCTYDLNDNYYYELSERSQNDNELRKNNAANIYIEKGFSDEKVINNLKLSESTSNVSTSINNNKKTKRIYTYNRQMPIVFIGGIAGSGLELLRELLNQGTQPTLRCGAETELITTIIEKKTEWLNIRMEKERLKHAGMGEELIDAAVAQFILQVLLRHVTPGSASVLCNKDIYAFKWADYLRQLFPRARFVLMVRDPRATVTSLIQRQFQYENIRLGRYEDALADWNTISDVYYDRCRRMQNWCRLVHYEQLIMNTNATLAELYKFLNVDFDPHAFSFSQHKNRVDVLLNKVLIKRDNLFSWLNDFPKNLVYLADKFAPLMTKLGYDTSKIVPNNLAYVPNVNL